MLQTTQTAMTAAKAALNSLASDASDDDKATASQSVQQTTMKYQAATQNLADKQRKLDNLVAAQAAASGS